MSERFLDGKITLHCGDCLDVLKTLLDNSIDSSVTDPPYGLEFMGKEWDKFGKEAKHRSFERSGFGLPRFGAWTPTASVNGISKVRDGNVGFQQFSEQWAREVYRVLKPGAHLLAFGGTRTYHRMACAIEDAGFEIRDTILYLYGSGFPKSHNIGNGLGTALKPACEPIVLARKPLSEGTVAANVLKHGTGALNIDGCRVATAPEQRTRHNGTRVDSTSINMAVDPISIPAAQGRWPANLILEDSEEVVQGFPETNDSPPSRPRSPDGEAQATWSLGRTGGVQVGHDDSGSAARYFYTAKADGDDRLGSKHPTVKPLDLMQYLVRLVCPRGGTVLDMFAGTGTTGEAAWREGMRAMLIEREAEYQADIRRRMKLCMAGPDERARESIKQRTKDKRMDHGPLFGNAELSEVGRKIYGTHADDGQPRDAERRAAMKATRGY